MNSSTRSEDEAVDENAMDEDVPMDEDQPASKTTGDGLEQYNLDNYDDEDSAPGEYARSRPWYIVLIVHFSHGSVQ